MNEDSVLYRRSPPIWRQQAEVFLREQSERVCEQFEAGTQKELTALTLLGGPEEGNEYYYNNEILQTARMRATGSIVKKRATLSE